MKRKLSYEEGNRRFGALLTVPVLAYMILVMLVPLIWAVVRSLQNRAGEFVGLDAYIRTLQDPDFYLAVVNTFAYAFCAVIGKVLLGMIVALVLNQKFRGRFFVRSVMLLPWAIP